MRTTTQPLSSENAVKTMKTFFFLAFFQHEEIKCKEKAIALLQRDVSRDTTTKQRLAKKPHEKTKVS